MDSYLDPYLEREIQLGPRESFPFLSNQSRMASWRRSDFRSYINAVRETFVRLGGKELEGSILRKLGKGWHIGSQGDLCGWSEACGGGGSAVTMEEVGKENKESEIAEASRVNKEEVKRARSALKL